MVTRVWGRGHRTEVGAIIRVIRQTFVVLQPFSILTMVMDTRTKQVIKLYRIEYTHRNEKSKKNQWIVSRPISWL